MPHSNLAVDGEKVSVSLQFDSFPEILEKTALSPVYFSLNIKKNSHSIFPLNLPHPSDRLKDFWADTESRRSLGEIKLNRPERKHISKSL